MPWHFHVNMPCHRGTCYLHKPAPASHPAIKQIAIYSVNSAWNIIKNSSPTKRKWMTELPPSLFRCGTFSFVCWFVGRVYQPSSLYFGTSTIYNLGSTLYMCSRFRKRATTMSYYHRVRWCLQKKNVVATTKRNTDRESKKKKEISKLLYTLSSAPV